MGLFLKAYPGQYIRFLLFPNCTKLGVGLWSGVGGGGQD
jgi:hypothetical protein